MRGGKFGDGSYGFGEQIVHWREGAAHLVIGAPKSTMSTWKMAATGRVEMRVLRKFCKELRHREEV